MTMTCAVAPSSLDTIPSHVPLATTEDVVYAWDTTNYVGATGDTAVTGPVFELTDLSQVPPAVVTLADAPTVTGLLIRQRLSGATLTPRHSYVAYVSFTGAQSNATMTMRTFIDVPF
jgi:hypothetical protein